MEVIGPQATLIGANTATASLTQALVDNELTSECASTHRYVGRTAQLSNLAHGVSGTITVLNDCEIEVTNFNYDGGGPSVYFYAAQDRAFSGNSFIVSEMLSGTRWINDTVRIFVPEGKTLDDFNSVSVWCRDFNANFGDAFFGDA